MQIHWDEKQAGFQDEPQQQGRDEDQDQVQAYRHRHYYRLCQAFAWCFHVGGEISLVLIHKSLVRNNYQSQVNFCLIV